MQRACRVNETQIQTLSERAQYDHSMVSGLLFIHLTQANMLKFPSNIIGE